MQNFHLLVCYILCFEVFSTNSRTTLWKLNSNQTKIIEATPFFHLVSYPGVSNAGQFLIEDDPLFNIIISTQHFGETWVKRSAQYYCSDTQAFRSCEINATENIHSNLAIQKLGVMKDDEVLDCGKPVNFTHYDHLFGVIHRKRLPNVPEPQAALTFIKKEEPSDAVHDLDIDVLERTLKKAKKEKPKSVQLYNQIGNFLRIKGDTEKAIECFRRALAVAPHDAEVLLNLAQMLFTVECLDDAAYLARTSIDILSHSNKKNVGMEAWQHYYRLGEIWKAFGDYQEATKHFRRTLERKPDFEPAQIALKELEGMPTVHTYTLAIIICMVIGVLLLTLFKFDNTIDNEGKPQGHFNNPVAVRNLHFGGTQKRLKRNNT